MTIDARPAGAASGSPVVDPWVVALAERRTAENVAVFGQLEALAGMWSDWAADPLEELDDVERRRWHTSLRELHESLVVTEAAGVLSMTEGAADRRVEAAVALLVTRRLPLTARLARRGRLEWRRIDALVTKSRCLTPELCAEVERQVLVPAVVQLTIGRFEDAVDRAVISVDPQAAEERLEVTADTRALEAVLRELPRGIEPAQFQTAAVEQIIAFHRQVEAGEQRQGIPVPGRSARASGTHIRPDL